MNHLRFSVDLWDTVLSAGIPSFILASDDCHDIYNPTLFGRCCTFIQTDSYNSDSILNNLQKGKAYGVELAMPSEDIYVRAEYHKNIPRLHRIDLIGDTLIKVQTDRPAKMFYFIGQNGVLKDSVQNSSIAEYVFKKNDTYIRTEIIFDDYTRLLLNPLFRYQNKDVFNLVNPINKEATIIKRITYFTLIGFIIFLFLMAKRYFKKKKKQSNDSKSNAV